jgi:predicted transcriptional regulator
MSIESEIAAYLGSQTVDSESVRVTLTIDGYLLSRVDKIAEHAEMSRSRVFTELIEYAIGNFQAFSSLQAASYKEGDNNV